MTLDFLPFGFLPVYKPSGPTSHDVVGRLRRLLPRKTKVGHTGTLDPFASGVLIIAIGKATRFADDVHGFSKSYQAHIHLGSRTNTLDPEGETDLELPVPTITAKDLESVRTSLLGPQEQIPPVFSAKKIEGRKSYELARKNQEVKLKACHVTIHDLTLEQKNPETLWCTTHCSTGTYIRSLGRDIGEKLGTCAHLTTLERTQVGPVDKVDCVPLEQLAKENIGTYLWPVSKLLPQFPEVVLPDGALQTLIHGRPLPMDEHLPPSFLGICRDENGVAAIFRCIYDVPNRCVQSKMQCYMRLGV